MAVTNIKYLDYEGLQKYDARIKEQIPEPDNSTITVVNGKWTAQSPSASTTVTNETLNIYNLRAILAVDDETLVI